MNPKKIIHRIGPQSQLLHPRLIVRLKHFVFGIRNIDPRQFRRQTDIQTQKEHNIHIHEGTTKSEFVQMRHERDATLSMPKLILPSIQINMKAGQFPEPEENGVSYLKLPLNFFKT